jgi:hypothetical protein
VRLRGRPEALARRRRCARRLGVRRAVRSGAQPQAVHGPLQRLLEAGNLAPQSTSGDEDCDRRGNECQEKQHAARWKFNRLIWSGTKLTKYLVGTCVVFIAPNVYTYARGQILSNAGPPVCVTAYRESDLRQGSNLTRS